MSDEKKVAVKINPTRPEGHQREYSNYIEVMTTPFDVSLKFCDVTPLKKEEIREEAGNAFFDVPVSTEIVIPKEVAEGLIQALQSELKKGKDQDA